MSLQNELAGIIDIGREDQTNISTLISNLSIDCYALSLSTSDIKTSEHAVDIINSALQIYVKANPSLTRGELFAALASDIERNVIMQNMLRGQRGGS